MSLRRCLACLAVLTLLGSASIPAVDPPAAPADAVEFEGHHYLIVEDVEELSWSGARDDCAARGGHLTVITTQAEAEFIATICDGRYMFLGASDAQKEGEWLWVDGSAWEFTWWYEGQPNDYNGAENYLATYKKGRWVDVDHEGEAFWMPTGYICEWEH